MGFDLRNDAVMRLPGACSLATVNAITTEPHGHNEPY